MIRQYDLKIIDRDFAILKQLVEEDYRFVDSRHSGGTCDRLRWLIDSGFVQSRKGNKGGHKLLVPLSDIPFSSWVDQFEVDKCNPTFGLLHLFRTKSVRELLSYPQYTGASGRLSLDHIVAILHRLSMSNPTHPRQLNYPVLSPGYIAHLYTDMCRCGVTRHKSRKGVTLSKPFDWITLGDVLPLLSNKTHVFFTLAHYAHFTPLGYICQGLDPKWRIEFLCHFSDL